MRSNSTIAAFYISCQVGSGISNLPARVQGKRDGIPRMLRLSDNYSSTFSHVQFLKGVREIAVALFMN